MKKLTLSLALALSGCATWFPAAVDEIEQGVYTITTTGNSFASQEKMRLKLNKKAESLCGDAGYSERKGASVDWHEQKDYNTGITSNYQQMKMTIECNNK